MDHAIFNITDSWLTHEGPRSSIVVSCRARFARNIAGLPFPPRAHESALRQVVGRVSDAVACSEFFDRFLS